MLEIGRKIKTLREYHNFTQRYIADQLNISQSYYSRIEKDAVDISVKLLTQIAALFEMEPWQLLSPCELKIVFPEAGTHESIPVKPANFPESRLLQLESELMRLRKEVLGITKS